MPFQTTSKTSDYEPEQNRSNSIDKCPVCGSKSIEINELYDDQLPKKIEIAMYCEDCDNGWIDVYKPYQRKVTINNVDKRISLEKPSRQTG